MEINHWTQQALGKQIGVTHVSIGKWLTGQHKPDPISLQRLADLTHTAEIDLFLMVGYLRSDGHDQAKEPRSPYAIHARQRAIDIFHEIADWPDESLDLLLDLIKFVLKPRIKRE